MPVHRRHHPPQGPGADRGAVMVEFALVLPILLTLVFAVLEFGWAMGKHVEVRNLAREGTRIAEIGDLSAEYGFNGTAADNTDDLVEAICAKAVQVRRSLMSVTVDFTDENNNGLGDDGESVAVAVAYTYDGDRLTSLVPFVPDELVGQSVATLESDANYEETTAEPCP